MKMTIAMPNVSSCGADKCVYNQFHKCHARAITIGDIQRPGCDTFFTGSEHVRNVKQIAGVGACKVSACSHNQDYECTADSIEVGFAGNEVVCMTYEGRPSVMGRGEAVQPHARHNGSDHLPA